MTRELVFPLKWWDHRPKGAAELAGRWQRALRTVDPEVESDLHREALAVRVIANMEAGR